MPEQMTIENVDVNATENVTEAITAKHLPVQATARDLLDQATRAQCTNDTELALCADLVKLLRACKRTAEDQRKGWVAPLNSTVKRINDGFRDITGPIDVAIQTLKDDHMDPYVREQERKAREERERIAREQREAAEAEAKRIRQAEDEARAKARRARSEAKREAATAEADAAGDQASRIEEQAERFERVVQTAPAGPSARGVHTGASVGTRRTWKMEITDATAIPREFLTVDETALRRWWDDTKTAITRQVEDEGLRGKAKEAEVQVRLADVAEDVPGVRWFLEASASVR